VRQLVGGGVQFNLQMQFDCAVRFIVFGKDSLLETAVLFTAAASLLEVIYEVDEHATLRIGNLHFLGIVSCACGQPNSGRYQLF